MRLARRKIGLRHRCCENLCGHMSQQDLREPPPIPASRKRHRLPTRGCAMASSFQKKGNITKFEPKRRCSPSRSDRPYKKLSDKTEPKFKADIAGGSLKLQESRIIAGLLLDDVDPQQWKQAIEEANVLQKRSPATAMRQATLLRARLTTMGPGLVAVGSRRLERDCNARSLCGGDQTQPTARRVYGRGRAGAVSHFQA